MNKSNTSSDKPEYEKTKGSTDPLLGDPNARKLLFATIGISLAFALPLYELIRLALDTSLYSHIPLIPVISGYFLFLKKDDPLEPSKPAVWLAVLPCVAATTILVLSWNTLQLIDLLSARIAAYVLLIVAAACITLGIKSLRAFAFPLSMLVFMIPFPAAFRDGIDTFLQHSSAEAAYGMLRLAGTPVFRNELIFQLPGITLEVAPQCSGIRASLVLFITSIIAANLFLTTSWKRTAIVLFVIPLAIFRNGLRVFTIAQLCVHISPDMIHSFWHNQGGPIFFAISMIPFSIFLYFLWKSDHKRQTIIPHRQSNSAG